MASISNSSAAAPMAVPRSPWHSPVPYLFGGLAAMLGLIAFALLILACSYWKLSGRHDDGERDLEAAEDGGDKAAPPPPAVLEEKFLVIMAGQEKPTYLATPMSSRASSFGSKSLCSTMSSLSSTLSEEELENGIGDVEGHSAAGDQGRI